MHTLPSFAEWAVPGDTERPRSDAMLGEAAVPGLDYDYEHYSSDQHDSSHHNYDVAAPPNLTRRRSSGGLRRRHSSSQLEMGEAARGQTDRHERRIDAAKDVTMPRTHETATWYLGLMSEAAADHLLLQKGATGTFVVRGVPEDSHAFVLSVRAGDGVLHMPVTWQPASQWFELTGRADFRDLSQLVNFYRSNALAHLPDGSRLRLTTGFGGGALLAPASIAPGRMNRKLIPLRGRGGREVVGAAAAAGAGAVGNSPTPNSRGNTAGNTAGNSAVNIAGNSAGNTVGNTAGSTTASTSKATSLVADSVPRDTSAVTAGLPVDRGAPAKTTTSAQSTPPTTVTAARATTRTAAKGSAAVKAQAASDASSAFNEHTTSDSPAATKRSVTAASKTAAASTTTRMSPAPAATAGEVDEDASVETRSREATEMLRSLTLVDK